MTHIALLRRVAGLVREVAAIDGDHYLETRRAYRGETVEEMLHSIDRGGTVVYWSCIPNAVLQFVL